MIETQINEQGEEVKVKLGRISPHHYNRNLLCAVDVETTGLIPGEDEIIQLAVIPLKADYTPSKEFKPIDLIIRPEHMKRGAKPWITEKIIEARLNGMERWSAVEYFREWFNRLKLAPRTNIVPLGQNYQFDLRFLIEFFGGYHSYSEFFRDDYRDTQKASLVFNDISERRGEHFAFAKSKLSYLASVLGVEHLEKHDAVCDAITTAEVYKRILDYCYWYPMPKLPRSTYVVSTNQIAISQAILALSAEGKLGIGFLEGVSMDIETKKLELCDEVVVLGKCTESMDKLVDSAKALSKKIRYLEV